MVGDNPGTSRLSLRGLLNTPQRTVIAVVALVGVLVTLAGSWLIWNTEQDDAARALDTRTQVVVDSTTKALSDATLRLAAVSGLYQASELVTEIEFRRFVKKLGLLPGLEAIGYMPQVMGRNREAYETEMRATVTDFEIYEIDESGNRIPAVERRVHVPLQWYEPLEAFDQIEGFDSTSDEDRLLAIEQARVTRGMTVSPFLRLVSEEEGDGFVMYWPVTDAETDALIGYAVAAMDLSELVEGAVSDAFEHLLDWSVVDVTGAPAGSPVTGVSRIGVGSRTWEMFITPAVTSDMTPDPSAALFVLVAGLVATAFVTATLRTRQRHRTARRGFEKLRELTHAKDQFLASVGHELRTPLTSVLGFAELLRTDTSAFTDDERVKMISSVADEATDLAAIVDDLLVAARSELELLVVTEVPVSARAQVAQVIDVNARGECEKIEIVGDPDNQYWALGDPSRVRQILRNLITNACRYGGDKVVVRLSMRGPYVSVVVSDNGTGVSDDESEEIFTPYYRAHSIESQPAALGIGLSVARQLARLMNGDLVYRRERGWTLFELVLPVAPETALVAFRTASDGPTMAQAPVSLP
ncbi:MAG TPA: CHASE domain-containing protein [Acidimicrobiia bacterium]